MLGFTRIDLSLLGNLRGIWVLIIGLELLSLTGSGLSLGSGYVTSFTHVSPCHCLLLLLLFPVIMENRDFG
jgi:hypothetical protein